jgi:hypothetical protein
MRSVDPMGPLKKGRNSPKGRLFVEANMKNKRHQKLCDHYEAAFGEGPVFSLKPKRDILPAGMKPITTLVFKPTGEMPFWKLCTIGASDYLMPERDIGWGRKANRRSEYVMLIAPEVDISESSADWLLLNSLLWSTAEYAFGEKDNITVSDTIDMGINGKYCGAVLLLPEAFKSQSFAKCYISKHKYITIFQVMPITKELLDKKLSKKGDGAHWLMEQFYTHDDDYKLISSKPLATL